MVKTSPAPSNGGKLPRPELLLQSLEAEDEASARKRSKGGDRAGSSSSQRTPSLEQPPSSLCRARDRLSLQRKLHCRPES
mmetsp:Transcript_36313/g.116303  ORF Transcript_36313/g.116303 Transcript_36313/m.116303 type:complete len:80 (+) Transcript_36313:166-405(+)